MRDNDIKQALEEWEANKKKQNEKIKSAKLVEKQKKLKEEAEIRKSRLKAPAAFEYWKLQKQARARKIRQEMAIAIQEQEKKRLEQQMKKHDAALVRYPCSLVIEK